MSENTVPEPRDLREKELTSVDGGNFADSSIVWLGALVICPLDPYPRDYTLRF